MRSLAVVITIIAVGFLGVMGYYWSLDGSLEKAGAHMDKTLESVDRSTEPLQKELGDLGDAAKDTMVNATDGDDHT